MATTNQYGDVVFHDTITFKEAPNLPDAAITNAMIAENANALINAEKAEHQFGVNLEQFDEDTNVAAKKSWMHIVNGSAGEVAAFEAAIAVAITGDYTVTVDLEKSTGAGAFASILTNTIDFSSSDAVRTAKAAVINTATLTDGDILRVNTTVSGSSGTQAQGLMLTLSLREDPS